MQLSTKFNIGDKVYSTKYQDEQTTYDGVPAVISIKRKRGPFFITDIQVTVSELRESLGLGAVEIYHLSETKQSYNSNVKQFYVSVEDLTTE